ncbi:MAG: porin, partial [Pseudomonadota bacterium]
MIGGLKRTSSRLAIAAAAGMFVGGAAMTPAQAADLGGDCCADLEERVAELEATTVRHARRQMRLVMSGQVNSALLFWDNGEESDIYVIDSDESSTRLNLRFTGTAVPGITVGGQIEVDFETAVGGQFAENDNDDGVGTDLNVRRAEWFVSGDFGTASVGQGSMAADGAFEVSFSGDEPLSAAN